ncbi:hypothetical protein [Sphingomonas immobilis]|uniref:Holin n=1 Tax=Sphingomonas immobilis TaxID=3063997 RepID=A0ABT9A2K2_9SPHN|nr:hypothetical protein [Sphingomonas sp. CA1-15]MDO7843470.1 hypothetical protein [Sphingomonas sp. CA1-15]
MSETPDTGTIAPIAQAETVNVSAGSQGDVHPAYVWIIGGFTIAVLIGFGLVTWAVLKGDVGAGIDAATKGSIIQTWNNLAVGASAVWTGTKLVDAIAKRRTS